MTVFTSTGSKSGPPAHVDRSGQEVTVVRPLRLGDAQADTTVDADMEVRPMFRVRFPDGVEMSAFSDELAPAPIHPQQAEVDAFMEGY